MIKRTSVLCALIFSVGAMINAEDLPSAIDYVSPDVELFIKTYNSPNPFLVANPADGNVTVSASPTSFSALWQLMATESDNVYYLYNRVNNLYVGKTSTEAASQTVSLVNDISLAGRYEVIEASASGNVVAFRDIDNTTGSAPYLNASNSIGTQVVNYMLMNGTNWRPNSMFYLSDDAATTASISQAVIDKVNANIGDYIGDYKADKINPLVSALSANLSNLDAGVRLEAATNSDDYVNMPIDGHFYRITSAFPYFAGDYLKETYYTYDYHPAQNRQRVYFHSEDLLENEVPSYWIFDRQDKKNGTDADNYYFLRAVNSRKVMRYTSNNTIVDLREDTNEQAGLYSIVKDNRVVYDHAVALKSHFNNDNRTLSPYPYLGTFTINQGDTPNPYAHDGEETDVRDGCNILSPTDDYVQGANNWRIAEVTTMSVHFYHSDDIVTYNLTDESKYYNAVCYPFAVKLPEELKAYSAGVGLVNGGTTLWLTRIETPDGRQDVIPANSPAIIEAPEAGTYQLTILYDAKYRSINFGLEGTITPLALESNEKIYVIHDDCDQYARGVVEGTDYSYDPELEQKDTGKPAHSLYNSDSTYIVPANTAYVKTLVDQDYLDIEDLGLPTTGVEDVTIDAPGKGYVTDSDGNPVYYDLCGRRVVNPTAGLYILSNGKKVIVK